MEAELLLPETLYLLSIHPEKGGLVNSAGFSLDYSVIAACIMELQQKGNIEVEGNHIVVRSFKSDNPVCEFILSKFRKFNRPLKINRWLHRIRYSIRYILKELKKGLYNKGFISLEDRKFLFFRWQRPRLVDKKRVRELVDSITAMIFSGQKNDELQPLIAVLEPAGLLKRLVPDRQRRKDARRRIKLMNLDSAVSIALKKAIAASHAAVVS